jgi:hypothetical protein
VLIATMTAAAAAAAAGYFFGFCHGSRAHRLCLCWWLQSMGRDLWSLCYVGLRSNGVL